MFDYEAAIAAVQAAVPVAPSACAAFDSASPECFAPKRRKRTIGVGQPVVQPPLKGHVVWTRDNAPAPIRARIRNAERALEAAFPSAPKRKISRAEMIADNEANGVGRGRPVSA